LSTGSNRIGFGIAFDDTSTSRDNFVAPSAIRIAGCMVQIMATTTEPKAHDGHPAGYAEDDKLGPLGSTRAVIDDEAALRSALVAEFQDAAEAARDAAAAVDYSAPTAVHDYRKALRRARAVLSLVANELPRSERRAVLRALRDARRALGAARDHAVAPDTVSLLSLDDAQQATIKQVLSAAADAVPPLAEIRQLLAEGAARTAAQVEALEAALPATLRWSTVLRGVRDVYRRARRARRDAKGSKRAFHSWRRRTKELLYQLDVLGGYTGQHVSELHRDLEHATDTQGPVVDLIMLRDFARTHGGGITPEAVDSLVDAIDKEISHLMRDARRAADEVFDRKPKRFAKKLDKAARADTTPPDLGDLPDDVD
jgi:CHAD domain-containing protein